MHILPAPTHIDADQMSPIRAADPWEVGFVLVVLAVLLILMVLGVIGSFISKSFS